MCVKVFYNLRGFFKELLICCKKYRENSHVPLSSFPHVSLLHMMVHYHNQEIDTGRVQRTVQPIFLGFD